MMHLGGIFFINVRIFVILVEKCSISRFICMNLPRK